MNKCDVYKISCQDCEAICVEQTKRQWITKIKKSSDINKSTKY